MEPITLIIKFPHTEPITPIISGIMNAKIESIPDDIDTRNRKDKLWMLNNSLFVKSEFAKTAYYIIKNSYEQYARPIGEMYKVNPQIMYPALREINNLIFELGSILDFLSWEMNIAYDLGLKRHEVGFNRLISVCEKKIPDEEVTDKICKFAKSELHQYFRKMRNRLTHRLPFVVKGMNDQLFFPDNPYDEDISPKTDNQIDILERCNEWIYGIIGFVDMITLLIFQEIAKFDYKTKDGKSITYEEWIETSKKEIREKNADYHRMLSNIE